MPPILPLPLPGKVSEHDFHSLLKNATYIRWGIRRRFTANKQQGVDYSEWSLVDVTMYDRLLSRKLSGRCVKAVKCSWSELVRRAVHWETNDADAALAMECKSSGREPYD